MEVDADLTNGNSLGITRTAQSTTTQLSDVISTFRPTKVFRREDIKDGRPQPQILSLDYDDPGELLMTSESDETIQIYNVREGRHNKSLLSKKYGVKHAKFTHASSSIIYASTKQNDQIRYLATHDNSFIRYFEGHEDSVTCLAMHPGADRFISCGQDNTVRLWNINTKQWVGKLELNGPTLAAYDPSGKVFAVASPSAASVLLYDCRNFDKAPFQTIDVLAASAHLDTQDTMEGWTKLEFSNDGKHLLIGTNGNSHFLLDAFTGQLKAHLRKPEGGTRRRAPGAQPDDMPRRQVHPRVDSSGECVFTVDGRFVLSGSRKNVLVWDVQMQPDGDKFLDPTQILEDKREAAVLAFNPRYNFFATADQEVLFWLPDPHA